MTSSNTHKGKSIKAPRRGYGINTFKHNLYRDLDTQLGASGYTNNRPDQFKLIKCTRCGIRYDPLFDKSHAPNLCESCWKEKRGEHILTKPQLVHYRVEHAIGTHPRIVGGHP